MLGVVEAAGLELDDDAGAGAAGVLEELPAGLSVEAGFAASPPAAGFVEE